MGPFGAPAVAEIQQNQICRSACALGHDEGVLRRPKSVPVRVFPEALSTEARQHRNGYVYEIRPGVDRNGRVPPEHIVGAWAVGPDGVPTGEFTPNPKYDGPTCR